MQSLNLCLCILSAFNKEKSSNSFHFALINQSDLIKSYHLMYRSLKAHNQLFGKLLYISIYITNKAYIYSRYKPDKIGASETSFWRYQHFNIQISMEAVKQPYCLDQNTMFVLKVVILLEYIRI